MTGTGSAQLEVEHPEPSRLRIKFAGDWRARPGLPSLEKFKQSASSDVRQVEFDASGLEHWDSSLLVWLVHCREWCQQHSVEFRSETLPAGPQKLLQLSSVSKGPSATTAAPPERFFAQVGSLTLSRLKGSWTAIEFLGQCAIALGRLFRRRAQFRWSDALLVIQECGPNALGIVALINVLVGMIMAFVGSVQLIKFGAVIYVADLVAIATVREMGAMMTGIIMSGRTGAAFAAQLGTMKVNEEIDSFQTFGISPVEFLVLPRLIALTLMMPLLCVFADLLGVLGGVLIALLLFDVTLTEYIRRTFEAITLTNFSLGIVKGAIFGVLIAVAGCLRGIQCGRTAADVGAATTSAVVTGITALILADAIFAILCNAFGI